MASNNGAAVVVCLRARDAARFVESHAYLCFARRVDTQIRNNWFSREARAAGLERERASRWHEGRAGRLPIFTAPLIAPLSLPYRSRISQQLVTADTV